MAQEDLDALLARMDSIAKAVNSFTSESVQQSAFAALVAAFEGGRHPHRPAQHHEKAPPPLTTSEETPAGSPQSEDSKSAPKKRKTNGSSKTDWTLVKDLDLRPKDKQSFQEFIEEKQPRSNEDKYVAVVYYLEQILGLSKVTKNDVGTVFRITKSWKEPNGVLKGLRVTASRKGTLDTEDGDNLKTTPNGRNFVEHELPAPVKAKK